MYEERRKRWFAAARSGKYQQSKNVLKSADGCCCILGIACEVYQEEVGDLEISPTDGGTALQYDDHAALPPLKVQRYFNITDVGDFKQRVEVTLNGWRKELSCATNVNMFFDLPTTVDILERAEFEPCPL
jgi:hypothetical protein